MFNSSSRARPVSGSPDMDLALILGGVAGRVTGSDDNEIDIDKLLSDSIPESGASFSVYHPDLDDDF